MRLSFSNHQPLCPHGRARVLASRAVAQTFQSAVSRVFQPAGRVEIPSARPASDAQPTRKSAKRQTGKSALQRISFGASETVWPAVPFKPHQSTRGVALVITLLMLSLITFLAVSFLSLSRRERASVTVSSEQTDAQLAVDAALARAEAEFVARVVARSNLFAYDMMVSTNFINPLGFNKTGAEYTKYTNVSYVYPAGGVLNNNDQIQNIANLVYDPRPPVYVVTNEGTAPDFRFYLDLNQNGRFETNGLQFVLNAINRPIGQPIAQPQQFFIGDPEWIGLLERPDQPHSGSNRFVARYCFIAIPAGKILDLNYVHNQAKLRGSANMPPASESFFRNQGVGTWEINLAAFFRDLNTNNYCWGPLSYNYTTNLISPSTGVAFEDALDILRYRYGTNRNSLKSLNQFFNAGRAPIFQRSGIDIYPNLVTNVAAPNTALPWPGSDVTNSFYDPGELFTAQTTSPSFVNRLQAGSTNNGSYDRYTYYRLLEQLGVDDRPVTPPRIHLNFNTTPPNTLSNLVDWTPLAFFAPAANRLLRDRGYSFGITNIQIYPTNQYTAGVHQMLQLVANIYDATTNRVTLNAAAPYLPTVLRPVFQTVGTNIFISGYREVTNDAQNVLNHRWRDLTLAVDRSALQAEDNVFGVPFIIGAKKGYPNFNECALECSVEVTRKLQVEASGGLLAPGRTIVRTNQMYIMGISNLAGIEAWNSYTQSFPRPVRMLVTNSVTMALTNQSGQIIWPPSGAPFVRTAGLLTNINGSAWLGKQLLVPIATNVMFLSNSVYLSQSTPHFFDARTNSVFDKALGNPTPQWGLGITNRLQYIVLDQNTGRIIDFVNLAGLQAGMDVTRELLGRTSAVGESSTVGSMWLTNRLGLIKQIQVSLGNEKLDNSEWANIPQVGNVGKEIDSFRVFMGLNTSLFGNSIAELQKGTVSNTVHQVPYTPTRRLVQSLSWQANDPLVHYTIGDLYDPTPQNPIMVMKPPGSTATNSNLGKLNTRYRPWGGNPTLKKPEQDENPQFKDPLVRSSDDWDFPTNKFPNIGMLGRVHRGTPWQTVYLKSGVPRPEAWLRWAGVVETHPTNDWRVLESFTVAPNDNAARGLLSVNQTNLAAWSAVLSGVMALSNTIPNAAMGPATIPHYTNVVIQPNSPQLRFIVDSIRLARSATNRPSQVFHTLGEVLAAPALSDNSPFLNLSQPHLRWGLNDAAYERIPQQILSLLKSDEPKLVVYAYGQSLKPAPNSIVTSGNHFNICTNYQITGEVATKTVMHLEGTAQNPRVVVDNYVVLPPDR